MVVVVVVSGVVLVLVVGLSVLAGQGLTALAIRAAELARVPAPALVVAHTRHVLPLGLVGGGAAVVSAAGAGGVAGPEGGGGHTDTQGEPWQPGPKSSIEMRTPRSLHLLDTLEVSLVPAVLGREAASGEAVVHTPPHQAPEPVAQPGAVTVVQAGHLRPLLLQGVPQAGGQDQPETEEPGGRHVTAVAPATLQALYCSVPGYTAGSLGCILGTVN